MHQPSEVDSHAKPLDAESVKRYLESFGIRVGLHSDPPHRAALDFGPTLGGIRLFVDSKDTSRATALLQSFRDAQPVPGVQLYESACDLASRAFRLSLLGLVLFPIVMHVYVISMLFKVPTRALSTKGRWQYAVAWLVSMFVVTALAAYLVKQAMAAF